MTQGSCMLQHVSECPSFLRLNYIPLYRYTTSCLPTHPSVDIWVAPHFSYLDNAAMNTGVQTFLRDPAFNCLGNVPRSEIAGSHGNSIFNFLRNCHHSGFPSFHSYQQYTRVSMFPHTWQHLLFFVFFE